MFLLLAGSRTMGVGAVSDPSGSYPGFNGEVGREFIIFPSFFSNLNIGFVEVQFPRGIP